MGSKSIAIASSRTVAEPVTIEDIDKEIVRGTSTNVVLNIFMELPTPPGTTQPFVRSRRVTQKNRHRNRSEYVFDQLMFE